LIDTPTTFRFIDLFAGLGGFHVALSGLGGKAVFASEWIKPLAELYQRNFGLMPHGDISQINAADVPEHDILAAGFPCQPFSKAGEQLGFKHTEQGQLFFEVLRILRSKRPQFFILENVPNLLTHRNGETMRQIERELRALGYSVEFQKLSPHNFGIPQIRDRVYIVGSLGGLSDFLWPKASGDELVPSIRDILCEPNSSDSDLPPAVLRCLDFWDRFIKAVPADVELPRPLWSMEFGATYPYEDTTPFALMLEQGEEAFSDYYGTYGASLTLDGTKLPQELPSHASRQQTVFPKWKTDFIRRNREFYSANAEWINPFLSELRTFPSSWQKLEWNVGGGERSIWKYVIQMRASGVRVKRATTSPSLVAMTPTQVPIIGWEKRYLTPREGARLQSLGDIELPRARKDAYKALGNAVNAEVVSMVAKQLLATVEIEVEQQTGKRIAA
jgi:DNA (cytosine-5)-methyltransferase 1